MKPVTGILLLLLIYPVGVSAQPEKLRPLFFAAGNSDTGIQTFYNFVRKINEPSNLEKAYKGVATSMYAKLTGNVARKFSTFHEGKNLVEEALNREPDNAEIRFLRFSVQSQAPWIVGYSENTREDGNMIIKALKTGKIKADNPFWKKAITFMLESNELSNTQMNELKKFTS